MSNADGSSPWSGRCCFLDGGGVLCVRQAYLDGLVVNCATCGRAWSSAHRGLVIRELVATTVVQPVQLGLDMIDASVKELPDELKRAVQWPHKESDGQAQARDEERSTDAALNNGRADGDK